MALYNERGNWRVTVNDTSMSYGIYAADGSLRVKIVDGSTFTGLMAADGSYNVVIVSADSSLVSLYHPCGAWRVIAATSQTGVVAPNGALYMEGLFYAVSFAGDKTNVLSWAFDDPVSDMGSVYIKDSVTPANDFLSADSAAILAKFTGWSATSPMMVRGRDGTLKHAPHNLFLYSTFPGAVSGTPGTVPTGWSPNFTNGTLTTEASSLYPGSNKLTIATTGTNRHMMNQNLTFVAGMTYDIAVDINIAAGAEEPNQYLGLNGILAGMTFVRYVDDVAQDIDGVLVTPGYKVPLGQHTIRIRCVVGATGGTQNVRVGIGCSGNTAGSTTISIEGIRCIQQPCHSSEYKPTTSAAVYSIPTTYDTSGNKLGFLSWEARTNAAWWSRDLTQSAHVKTNATAYKTARGTDGELNSASRLVATAANDSVIQTITAASAQRVSSAKVRRAKGSGTVKMSQGETTGSDLVATGDFAADTNWSKGTGVTIAAGVLTADTSVVGVIAHNTGGTAPVAGKLYKIVWTVTAVTSAGGGVSVQVGGVNGATIATTTGTFTDYVLAGSTSQLQFIKRGTTNWGGSIDNVTAFECTETTLSLDAVSYAEVSGTELVTNGGFDSGLTGWTNSSVGTGSVVQSGGKARCTTVDGSNYARLTQSVAGITNGKLYAFSFNITRISGASAFYVEALTAGPNANYSEGLNTVYFVAGGTSLTIGFQTAGNTAGVFDVDNISIKEVEPAQAWTEAETAAATITNPCVAIWCATSGDAIDVDHVQCEVGAKASPPIITAGAAVTRAATSLPISDSLYNWSGTTGTYVIWATLRESPVTWSGHLLNHGNDGRMYVSLGTSTVVLADGTTFPTTANSYTADARSKIAGAWGSNLSVCLNGGTVTNQVFDGAFGSGSLLYVGSGIGTSHINGIVHRFKYYPEDTADADLQAETA